MKIGDVAKTTGCSIQTIRFYEKKGLLPELKRSSGNYRVYDKGTIEQLLFIKQCRSLDMSIMEVKTALVTGANTGIGKEIALSLASNGIKVFIASRSYDRTLPVIQTVEKMYGAHKCKWLSKYKNAICRNLWFLRGLYMWAALG